MKYLYFLFWRRNKRLFFKNILFSMLIIILVNLFLLANSFITMKNIQHQLDNTETELYVNTAFNLQTVNENSSLDVFSRKINTLNNIFMSWETKSPEKIEHEGGYLLIELLINQSNYNVGIEFGKFKNSLINVSRSDINLITDLDNILLPSSIKLPDEVDLIINLNTLISLNQSMNIKIQLNSLKLIYYTSLLYSAFATIDDYNSYISNLEKNIQNFLLSNNIGSDSIQIESYSIYVNSYKIILDRIITTLTIITILVSSWLLELISLAYLDGCIIKTDSFEKRGANNEQKKIILLILPVIHDIVAYSITVISFLFFRNKTSIPITANILISSIIIMILILYRYQNYIQSTTSITDNTGNKSKRLFNYVLLIFLSIIYFRIIVKSISLLIPSETKLILDFIVSIALFYISGLLFAEIISYIIQNRVKTKSYHIKSLLMKYFIKGNHKYKFTIQYLLVICWSLLIIFSNFSAFNNFIATESNMQYPSDLVLEFDDGVDYNLFEDIVNINGIKDILPLSISQQNYIVGYTLYLTDFKIINNIFPELLNIAEIDELNINNAYVEDKFADKIDIKSDLNFPINYGINDTEQISTYLSTKVIKYFPLIKKSQNEFFVVGSLNHNYENFTRINRLYINIQSVNNSNSNNQNIINSIEEITNQSVKLLLPPNNEIYEKYIVFLVLAIVILFITLQGIFTYDTMNKLSNLKKLLLRGLSVKEIHFFSLISAISQLTVITIYSIILSIIYSIYFLPNSIYMIDRYSKINIDIVIFIIPIFLLVSNQLLVSWYSINNKLKI